MTDDMQLQQWVSDELAFEPKVDAAHIGVSVHNGVVTLSGRVNSYAEKFAAEEATRRIKGVIAVAQELEVHLPSDKKTDDAEIAERLVRMFHWDTLVPHDRIKVKVERGYVTLSGEVEWHYQRAEAEADARKLGGVKAVINDIHVRPAIKSENVAARIRAALERNASTEADHVSVDVTGTKVTLTGKVNAWTERETIERAAWSVPGVTEVDDRIGLARP
jgi:osmotically-inducible protein OsmY